jgi:RNA polymerase sigma-70 factor (ECF subfamily)
VNPIVPRDLPTVSGRTGPPLFATTDWEVVLEAGHTGSPQFQGALEQLCRTYWLSLYGYLRRRGWSPEDAQDLTQGFFLRLLRTNSLVGVSPVKGQFRSFLLAALKHYVSDQRDRARALKRGGRQTIISIDAARAEACFLELPSRDLSPEMVFDQSWAVTVLEEAFRRLSHEYARSGRGHLFSGLSQFLSREAGPGEYESLAGRLGMSEQALGVAVHRLRQRYRECVRYKVGETVTDPEDLESEMHHLFSLLSG